MITTCFLCQNLLSDYLEGILPSARHQEIDRHLHDCDRCKGVHRDLTDTIHLLKSLPLHELSQEMQLRIAEASQAGRHSLLNRATLSRAVLMCAVPCILFAGMVMAFPRLFPWFFRGPADSDESQMVRYYPLAQGASEILDDQTAWLQVKQPFMRSVWEEGGLSPEEFEKTFEAKPSLPDREKSGGPKPDAGSGNAGEK